MPKNLELKIKIDSLKDIKKKLNENRIGLKEILIQKDIYFSVNSGLLKLRIENGKSSLIYYNRNEVSDKRLSDFEYIKFSEGEPEKFFKQIFKTDVTVSKIRELYIYNNTRIHLDKVQGLGSFIELETLVVSGLKDAEQRFKKMIKTLNLTPENQIRSSYRDLLIKKKYDSYKRKNKLR